MPQFIKANICFRESLVPGAVPVAPQTLHTAKSDSLNHLNLSQAAAGDSTWHLTLFTHECVWGILQIPQPLGNASNPERFWMMPFLLGLDGAWFTGSLHVRSSSINHTWLSLSEGVKSYQELFISLLVLSQWFFCICQMWGNAAFPKASLNSTDNITLRSSQSKSGPPRTVWVYTFRGHCNERNAYYWAVKNSNTQSQRVELFLSLTL